MQKTLGIISGVAGAIVGVAKLLALVAGWDWLLENWLDVVIAYGYVAAVLYVLLMTYLLWRGRRGLAKQQLFMGVFAVFFFVLLIAAAAIDRSSAIFLAVIAVVNGGAAAVVAGREKYRQITARTAKCPLCIEKAHVEATRCKHCHGEILRSAEVAAAS
ncbi:hypothetical protein DVA67_030760 [Solirubrobacter sp. CPCC 204708]|uniref:Zinc ribbon domain-containing protein n=1 Tax=Solirubrobacter deserti TaxID=2282478 RepID=A0ABT4RMB3_9ACTN|nr:hypothetical protein [Solirubrobacter deserti]MBE2320385.1 hypothetical protein [Solirubrobacter deserti]MDA0139420.1 hypothetical protein [Solirubrobacter deserti]